jgi:hypothetical protein
MNDRNDLDKMLKWLFDFFEEKHIAASRNFFTKVETLKRSNNAYIKHGVGTVSIRRNFHDARSMVLYYIAEPILIYWLRRDLYSFISEEYWKELRKKSYEAFFDDSIETSLDMSKVNFNIFPQEIQDIFNTVLRHDYEGGEFNIYHIVKCIEILNDLTVEAREDAYNLPVIKYLEQFDISKKPIMFPNHKTEPPTQNWLKFEKDLDEILKNN